MDLSAKLKETNTNKGSNKKKKDEKYNLKVCQENLELPECLLHVTHYFLV